MQHPTCARTVRLTVLSGMRRGHTSMGSHNEPRMPAEDEGEARHAQHMQPRADDLRVIRRRMHCGTPVNGEEAPPGAWMNSTDTDQLVTHEFNGPYTRKMLCCQALFLHVRDGSE